VAIAFGAAGTRLLQGTAGTSWAVPYPAGISAGHLLVLHIVTNGGAVTTPAGWTAVYNETVLANPKGGLFIKVAAGTESGNLTVTTASTAGNAIMLRYTGVDTTTPQDVAASTYSNSLSTDPATVLPSITTVTNNAWLVMGNGLNSGSTTVTSVTPAGATERIDHVQAAPMPGGGGGTGSKGGSVWDELDATAGATGTRTITPSAARANWGAMMALRPAASGGSPVTATPTAIASRARSP
jgi:hypothetical protein